MTKLGKKIIDLLLYGAIYSLIMGALCSRDEPTPAEEFARFRKVMETQKLLLESKNCPGCDLFQAQLATANLWGANLEGANLKGADLNSADLRDANLKGAILVRVDFSTNARLQRADLTDANFLGANLRNAALNDAIFCRTTMPDGTVRNDHCQEIGNL